MPAPTCPNCGRLIGTRGHRCRKVTNPIRTHRPDNFADLIRQARNKTQLEQLTLDLGAQTP